MSPGDRLQVRPTGPHAFEWTMTAYTPFTGSEGILAPCATHEADWFDTTEADWCKRICLTCSYRVKCASVYLEQAPIAQHFGVWAGFDMSSTDDRQAFRRWWGK